MHHVLDVCLPPYLHRRLSLSLSGDGPTYAVTLLLAALPCRPPTCTAVTPWTPLPLPNMFTMLVLLQLVFALVSPGRVVPNLVAGAIAEAGAQQAGDMMQVRQAWVARRGVV